MFQRVRHLFTSAHDKAVFLADAAADDATSSRVRGTARAICRTAAGDMACIEALFHYVRDCIHYADDPGDLEQFASSDVILDRQWDDCDGKARLFVALCRSLGIEARIRAVEDPQAEQDGDSDFYHVQAEVRAPGTERRPDAQRGGWLIAEFTLAHVELGEGSEARVQKGYV